MSHAQFQYWQISRLGTVPNGKFPEVELKKGQYWKWVPVLEMGASSSTGKLRVWALTCILFSKSGLAGQHIYLTPIVSTSFSLTSIYASLNALVIFEQNEIDKYVHSPSIFTNEPLLHAPKTHAKGVSIMLFINSTKYLFLERMVILLSQWDRPSVVLIPFPLDNVCSLTA